MRLYFTRFWLLLVLLALVTRSASGDDEITIAVRDTSSKLKNSRGLLLVSTVDGQLHCLDAGTGDIQWVLASKDPLISVSQAAHSKQQSSQHSSKPVDDEDEYGSGKEFDPDSPQHKSLIIPATDGSLFFSGQRGMERLPANIREIVGASPFRTNDGTVYVGHKKTDLFIIDKHTGAVKRSGECSTPLYASGGGASYMDEMLWIGKTEWIVNAMDSNTGLQQWNVTVAEYAAASNELLRPPSRGGQGGGGGSGHNGNRGNSGSGGTDGKGKGEEEDADGHPLPKIAVSPEGSVYRRHAQTGAIEWTTSLNSPVSAVHLVPGSREHKEETSAENSSSSNTGGKSGGGKGGRVIRLAHTFYSPPLHLPGPGDAFGFPVSSSLEENPVDTDVVSLYVSQMKDGSFFALQNPRFLARHLEDDSTTTENRMGSRINSGVRNSFHDYNGLLVSDEEDIDERQLKCNDNDNHLNQLFSSQNIAFPFSYPHPDTEYGKKVLSVSNAVVNPYLPACRPGMPTYPSCLSGFHMIPGELAGTTATTKQQQQQYSSWRMSPFIVRHLGQPRPSYEHPHSINSVSEHKNIPTAVAMTGMVLVSILISIIASVFSVSWYAKNYLRGKEGKQKQGAVGVHDEGNTSDSATTSTPATPSNVKKGYLSTYLPGHQDKQLRVGEMVIFSSQVLGTGSRGTVVFKGMFAERPVAVKRLVKPFFRANQAAKEIELLIAADAHPNMVRYFAKEEDHDFVYLALERCLGTLYDVVQYNSLELLTQSNSNSGNGNTNPIRNSSNNGNKLRALQEGSREKSSAFIKLASDFQSAPVRRKVLKHVLEDGEGKISDMGLGKKLESHRSSFDSQGGGSSGWQAPEVLAVGTSAYADEFNEVKLDEDDGDEVRSKEEAASGGVGDGKQNDLNNGDNDDRTGSDNAGALVLPTDRVQQQQRLTRSVDIFSIGCIMHYALTDGIHPFGAEVNRDSNVLNDNVSLVHASPEQLDCISSLIERTASHRLTAKEALAHPFFWEDARKLDFLCAVSEAAEQFASLRTLLDKGGFEVVGTGWDSHMHPDFLADCSAHRGYRYSSLVHYLRVIRNKKSHFASLSPALQKVVGEIPSPFYQYFVAHCPELLMYCFRHIAAYVYTAQHQQHQQETLLQPAEQQRQQDHLKKRKSKVQNRDADPFRINLEEASVIAKDFAPYMSPFSLQVHLKHKGRAHTLSRQWYPRNPVW